MKRVTTLYGGHTIMRSAQFKIIGTAATIWLALILNGCGGGGAGASVPDSLVGGSLGGSCTSTTVSGALTSTICAEYPYNSTASIQSSCTTANTGADSSTFNVGNCDTMPADLVGRCETVFSPSVSANTVFSGNGYAAQAAALQTSCTNGGGIWH
jgi:hypothetical protein